MAGHSSPRARFETLIRLDIIGLGERHKRWLGEGIAPSQKVIRTGKWPGGLH